MPNPRRAAEWLPTRFNLGAFRLLGLVVSLIIGKDERSRFSVLQHRSDQHALEPFSLTVVLLVFPTLHISALLWLRAGVPLLLVIPIALLLPIPLALGWDCVAFVSGGMLWVLGRVTGWKPAPKPIQTTAAHIAMVALSTLAVSGNWPTAVLGWAWLGFMAFNAVAAAGLWVARGPVMRYCATVRGDP